MTNQKLSIKICKECRKAPLITKEKGNFRPPLFMKSAIEKPHLGLLMNAPYNFGIR